MFNSTSVSQLSSQKHTIKTILDSKLIFAEHLKMVSLKINKSLGLLRKLQNLIPRSTLITICKASVRPHLDYGDMLYDQANNMTFHQKLESIQFNACLALTGSIRDTSKEKLYHELGLESLQLRRWYRKLGMFHKFTTIKVPNIFLNYLKEPMHKLKETLTTFPISKLDTPSSKTLFFPSTIIEWN